MEKFQPEDVEPCLLHPQKLDIQKSTKILQKAAGVSPIADELAAEIEAAQYETKTEMTPWNKSALFPVGPVFSAPFLLRPLYSRSEYNGPFCSLGLLIYPKIFFGGVV